MAFVIERHLEIDAPPAVVWQVLTDFSRYPEWNLFLVGCRSSLVPGEPIELMVKLGARAQPQREWMLEHQPGRRFAYQMKPVPLGALSSHRSHDVEALGAARTRYRSYFHLKGWLMSVVHALLRSRLEAGFAQMSEGLKQQAEMLWRDQQQASSATARS